MRKPIVTCFRDPEDDFSNFCELHFCVTFAYDYQYFLFIKIHKYIFFVYRQKEKFGNRMQKLVYIRSNKKILQNRIKYSENLHEKITTKINFAKKIKKILIVLS